MDREIQKERERARKINNPKNYWQSVYVRVHVQKDWSKNLGWSKRQWETAFLEKCHMFLLLLCMCIYALFEHYEKRLVVLKLILFFSVQMKNKEYRIENLLSRCHYYFIVLCSRRLYTHSFTRSCLNLKILMKFESIDVIFLAMVLPSKIQLTSSTVIFSV